MKILKTVHRAHKNNFRGDKNVNFTRDYLDPGTETEISFPGSHPTEMITVCSF